MLFHSQHHLKIYRTSFDITEECSPATPDTVHSESVHGIVPKRNIT